MIASDLCITYSVHHLLFQFNYFPRLNWKQVYFAELYTCYSIQSYLNCKLDCLLILLYEDYLYILYICSMFKHRFEVVLCSIWLLHIIEILFLYIRIICTWYVFKLWCCHYMCSLFERDSNFVLICLNKYLCICFTYGCGKGYKLGCIYL